MRAVAFDVVVGAGVYRSDAEQAVHVPHRWTEAGVSLETEFTGAHLLHLAVAGCVLNNVYREARTLGVELEGVRVRAVGGFDPETCVSTGVVYAVQLASSAPVRRVPAAPADPE